MFGGCDTNEHPPTPESTFPDEDPFARQIEGRVLYGTEVVPAAIVHIDASDGYASDALLAALGDPGWTTATDPGGKYHIKNGPLRYDLSVRTDREVAVFRALGLRFFDAPLGPQAQPSGFQARVAVTTTPPPKSGNGLAFFVTGADARTVSGDPSSLTVMFRNFDSTLTLHVVEYKLSAGLGAAINEGQADITVHDGAAVAVDVNVTPVPTSNDVTFDAAPPTGFTLAPLEVMMDLGLRTSANPVAHVAPGVPLTIALVPSARYWVHGRATQGAAISDSGTQYFDPTAKTVRLALASPLLAEAPIDDRSPPLRGYATLAPGGVLAARLGGGVVEHVLVPASGGVTIRVATETRETSLPDLTPLGLAAPTGTYAWSIQHYPTLTRIDDLRGEDARVVLPRSVSVAHTLVLR